MEDDNKRNHKVSSKTYVRAYTWWGILFVSIVIWYNILEWIW